MAWPWVSRGQYDAVLSAKDEVIRVLRDQVSALEHRLGAPISVSVTLPEGFAVQAPAVIGRRQKRQDTGSPRPAAAEIDYSTIDENDNAALAKVAAQELGTVVPPHVLSRTITQIKMQIRAAKRKKLEDSLKEGRVGTVSRPAPLTEEEAIAQGSKYVPSEILKEIELAERG